MHALFSAPTYLSIILFQWIHQPHHPVTQICQPWHLATPIGCIHQRPQDMATCWVMQTNLKKGGITWGHFGHIHISWYHMTHIDQLEYFTMFEHITQTLAIWHMCVCKSLILVRRGSVYSPLKSTSNLSQVNYSPSRRVTYFKGEGRKGLVLSIQTGDISIIGVLNCWITAAFLSIKSIFLAGKSKVVIECVSCFHKPSHSSKYTVPEIMPFPTTNHAKAKFHHCVK